MNNKEGGSSNNGTAPLTIPEAIDDQDNLANGNNKKVAGPLSTITSRAEQEKMSQEHVLYRNRLIMKGSMRDCMRLSLMCYFYVRRGQNVL